MSYVDEFGLMTDKNGKSGNAQLETAKYLVAGGDLSIDGIYACEVKPGLFVQHPLYFKDDQSSVDNAIGLACIANRKDPEIAVRYLAYLRDKKYLYVTAVGADWKCFFGFFFAMHATMKWATKKKEEIPNVFYRLAWAISVAFKLDATKHDSWIINWVAIDAAGDKGPLERWAVRRFWRKFPWPSMADCLEEYFVDSQHPTVLLLRLKKE